MERTKDTSAKPAEQRSRVAMLVGAFMAIGVALGSVISALAFTTSLNANAYGVDDDSSKQFAYQATVHNDRLDLFNGQLHATTDRRVKVTEWFDVRVLLCGPANTDERCVSPSRVGTLPTDPDTATDVRLGGRVGVTLAAADSAVEVKNLVNSEDSTQPLTDPTDAGLWVWDVRATRPGDYVLRASVFVMAADSKHELVPRETVTIRLKVERTGTYTAKQVGRTVVDVTRWSAPHLVAIVVALVGAGALTTLFRRWRSRRRSEKDPQPTG